MLNWFSIRYCALCKLYFKLFFRKSKRLMPSSEKRALDVSI